MLFQVMSIEFDFTGCLETHGSYELPVEEQQEVIDSVLGEVFEADSEDELADVISDQTGWCIKNLDYRRVYA
jgi:hypothetical protein